MNKNDFIELLKKSSELSLNFANKYVTNKLPDKYKYLVNINNTYDELKCDEETFPEEVMEYGEYTHPLESEGVVKLLLKNNKVPVWIDISVFKVDKEFTYFTLDCCNRFSASNNLYYYEKGGTGPFGIKSPVFPPLWDNIEKDKKFSLEIRHALLNKKWTIKKLYFKTLINLKYYRFLLKNKIKYLKNKLISLCT